jgi:hypothetical protein
LRFSGGFYVFTPVAEVAEIKEKNQFLDFVYKKSERKEWKK